MELDAFTRDLGRSQGRVLLQEPSPHAVVVLGDLTVSQTCDLTPGDFVEAIQEVDLTGETLLRVRGNLRVPGDLPDGFEWEVSLCVDQQKRAWLRASGGDVKSIDDLAVDVTRDIGVRTVSVRLELIETSD